MLLNLEMKMTLNKKSDTLMFWIYSVINIKENPLFFFPFTLKSDGYVNYSDTK